MSRYQWATAAAFLASSINASATQYATPVEAAKRCFPEATAFKESTAQLTPDEMRAVAAAAGLPARSATWRLMQALNITNTGEQVLGVVVFDGVVGKYELIDYAVGIAADGKVRAVEILSYRESRGYEVRLPAWRKQFVGKGADAKLRVGEDIANISGATLSTTNITDGVRRIVAVVATLRAHGKV
jgi:Na+-translocating ferredoxin:NAD+ oxidoreductase RnfG subunit